MSLVCAQPRDFQYNALYGTELNPALSAKDLLQMRPELSNQNGVYYIRVNGTTFPVYCDMTSRVGGWTMIVAQFENDPVTNWNEGRQADYNPSLATKKSFCLNSIEIPTHTETAFSQDNLALGVCAVPFVYKTGNIPKTLVTDSQTGLQYHVHRQTGNFYNQHDPESSLHTVSQYPEWCNSLTCDRTGGVYYTWAFSPNYPTVGYRGYAYNGVNTLNVELVPWTVWVR
jgi:hypothetical protein